MALSKSFRLFHKVDPPYSVILEERNTCESLLFESQVVAVVAPNEVETLKRSFNYTRLSDAYGCLGVLRLSGGNSAESSLFLVTVTGVSNVGKAMDVEICRVTGVQIFSLQRPGAVEDERLHELQKLLASGCFYFGWSPSATSSAVEYFDLTRVVQRAEQYSEPDPRFFWNGALFQHLNNFDVDTSKWLIRVVCGGFEIRTVYAGNAQARCCIFSRLSNERVGTRFECRGANDEGHVANFCETEQILYVEDQVSSFLQIRGSVPLFWEQPGIQVGPHKVRMSRGDEASAPVYNRHLNSLKKRYGDVAIVNLLGTKEGEDVVSKAFHRHHQASVHAQDVPLLYFDYHTECRGGKVERIAKLKPRMDQILEGHGFFFKKGEVTTRWQMGAVRTNCMDCLDRTNAVQTFLGMEILQQQMAEMGIRTEAQSKSVSRIQDAFKAMWTENGDHLARIYAGTGAIGGGRSKAADASRSVSRTIQNNFLDDKKQEAIDLLLYGNTLKTELGDKVYALLGNNLLHLSFPLLRDLIVKHQDYVTPSSLRVCVGTWNVNGGKNVTNIAFRHQTSLADWLVDAPTIAKQNRPETILDQSAEWSSIPDVYAVGFEEMVDLDAKNMIKTSSENQRIWAAEILKTLNATGEPFMPIYSEQLVGVCLYVFTKRKLAPHIRDVAVNTVKTGLGGAAGNKGGVAIRFLYKSTSLCFVCAHLAAGQKEIKERNENYHEITRRIQFPPDICRGRNIINHDYVFWCGDFNYRIDMANDQVKHLIKQENWHLLAEGDQLNLQKKDNRVFAGFVEGEINFPPTYKYDLFSDDYDTSEKCRCPAWTDRVLWRRRQLTRDVEVHQGNLLFYGRGELKTSDHRPVVAWFDIEVFEADREMRMKTVKSLLSSHGPRDATVCVTAIESSGSEATIDDEAERLVMDVVSEIGDILLIRFVDLSMRLTLKTGKMALEAVERLDQLNVNSSTLKLRARLANEKWFESYCGELEKALDLEGQVQPLYNHVSCHLLGEEFQVPDFQAFDPSGGLLNLPGVARSPFTSGRNTPIDLTPCDEPEVDFLTETLQSLAPSSPARSPGPKPPRPKSGPARPPPPRPAPPALTPESSAPGGVAAKTESSLGVPGADDDPMHRCPSASSLAAHARSQESLVSAGDETGAKSFRPIVTDPNEAWGDDGTAHAEHNEAPFKNETHDPFSESGWGSEPDEAPPCAPVPLPAPMAASWAPESGFNVDSSPPFDDPFATPPPPPSKAPVSTTTAPPSASATPPTYAAPPSLSSSRPPPSAPPPALPAAKALPSPDANGAPAVPSRSTPTHGPSIPPSVPRRPANGVPAVPPRSRGGVGPPPPVPSRTIPPPVPARGVKK